MREIKFRAWLTLSDYDDDGNDKDYHGMATRISVHHDGTIGFHVDEGNRIFGGDVFERARDNETVYEYEDWCYWEGQFELMQYTGLKDKNGVEIYEGDIVKRKYGETETVSYGVQEVDAFEGMGFNLWSFYGDEPDGTRLSNECEVIGNIYENKELLK